MKLRDRSEVSIRALSQLLEQWRRLTLAETNAITTSGWEALKTLQEEKLLLQPLIERVESMLFPAASEPESEEKKRLREDVQDLLRLEQDNRKLLANFIADADAQLKRSNKIIQSLRFVQRAYGDRSRSFWHSYS